MLKVVGSCALFAVFKHPCELILFASHEGIPISEDKRAGQAPRILTLEEQEKMRVVCKVCHMFASLRPERTGPQMR